MSAASAFFRETLLGQVVRLASGNKLFQYPEEKPGFVVPDFSKKEREKSADSSGPETLNEPDNGQAATDKAKEKAPSDEAKDSDVDLEKVKKAEVPPVEDERFKGAAELALIASKSADITLVDCENFS
jgi:hypothetical protein